MTRILAVRSAFPAHRYPQADITRAVASFAEPADPPGGADAPEAGGAETGNSETSGLGPMREALLERLHANAGVTTRHIVLPIGEYGALGGARGPGEPGRENEEGRNVNDRYIEEATALGERALRLALAASGLVPGDLDLLIVTSVTGVAVPSLDARLIPIIGLRSDLKRLPVFGLGCVAGAAGLARLHDYLRGWPQHAAALLAVELCSLSWPRTRVTTADLVASALFGDGATALVATGQQFGRPHARPPEPDTAPSGVPQVIATRSEVYPDSGDALGWRLSPDGFRIVLTAELAVVVERELSASVTGFLAAHGLTVDDIDTWICHPGGPRVLDVVQHTLKLPGAALELSRRSLSQVGNLSSASVLHILEQTAQLRQRPGSFGLMIGLGPGVSAELVLLRW